MAASRGSDRTERGRLQATIGELGEVHAYRHRIDDLLGHPDIGWYVTPAAAADGCPCGLCEARRAGRDLHLGSISRVAHINAGRHVGEHLHHLAAAA